VICITRRTSALNGTMEHQDCYPERSEGSLSWPRQNSRLLAAKTGLLRMTMIFVMLISISAGHNSPVTGQVM
jgi:hypothetical protein